MFPAAHHLIEEVLFEDPFSIGVGPRCDLKTRQSSMLADLRGRRRLADVDGRAPR